LIGVAASAPYFHDGSAPTLEGLLRDTGNVHGMADMDKLDDEKIADLVAYLQTL
jgi:cytochrome c peroxidase